MFWRKFKLDWTYAIGELVIVTLGVLVALGIQQWNEDRLELQEEKEILDHLLVDLSADRLRLEDQIMAATDKQVSLDRLLGVFSSGARPADQLQFLEDVVTGANYGWNQSQSRNSTYQEILSSGKFGLIRNASLRSTISNYQSDFNNSFIRADARESEFPRISYRLIPRSLETDREGILGTERGIADNAMNELVDAVLASEIRDYVIAEKNLARFILRQTADLSTQHGVLIEEMWDYRESLEN